MISLLVSIQYRSMNNSLRIILAKKIIINAL